MRSKLFRLFYIELLLSVRQPQDWVYPLAFYTVLVSLFPLALATDPVFLQTYFSSYIWVAALLTHLLSVENTFKFDVEEGYLTQLRISKTPLVIAIYLKLLVYWLVRQLPIIFITPLLGLLFYLNLHAINYLVLSLTLGSFTFVCIGCLSAALTIGLRQSGMLLGLLSIPLLIPILLFGIGMNQQIEQTQTVYACVLLLAGCAILAFTLLPSAIAAILELSLD
jgi:heme exporter protein B